MSTAPNQSPHIASLALAALHRYPDRIAFQMGDTRVSYRQALDTIARAQSVLQGLGVGGGQRFGILSANRWDTWCISLAAQALGVTYSPLHPMGSLDAHSYQIVAGELRTLVVDADHYAARGAEIAAAHPDLKIITVGADTDYGLDMSRAMAQAGSQTAINRATPDLISTLSFTGGTTGKPKGVTRTGGSNGHMALTVLAGFEWPQAPAFLAVAPISHVTGTNVVPVLMRGGTVHMLPKFDPELMLDTIQRQRISAALSVPTMIYALLDHPRLGDFDLSSLQLLMYGASPMAPARLQEGLERIGPVFTQLYGQSECYPIASLPKEDHDAKRPELLAACGFPVAGAEVVLLDDDGQPVKPGEPGEICVRSPNVMSGYLDNPEQTAEAFKDGWLHTTDVARADEQGRLYIVDRKKDMVVSGGFNVYPREVEDVLATHPAVAMSAVVGAPDPKWGEAVKAVVVLRAGVTADVAALTAELTQLVKDKKGAVHAPKLVEFAETLPMTPLGKIDKKALRAKDWVGQARNVA
ncbi:acyl-CoA synthetase [Comamonas serinivorans]|uniref:Acyl-CoA synthetase n=1 Tax=Comamonas serinivorans TaxID=1082851 RepID=A0A1Y0ERG8_9BURK|nr:AMP-binding protein [Comamonas serinivorans]ARU06020.1 acyl-CoA synthetase [Comamonas serinivorans]